MEQTLQQQWEKVLQSLLEIVQNGLDKAPDYVLDFFNRFQAWKLLDSIFWLIIFWWLAFFIARRVFKTLNRKDIDRDWDFKYTFWVVMLSIFGVLFVWGVFYNIYGILQVSIMPELSLIDFLKHYN
jgi:membrane protease YdiL (CAAX protease family)